MIVRAIRSHVQAPPTYLQRLRCRVLPPLPASRQSFVRTPSNHLHERLQRPHLRSILVRRGSFQNLREDTASFFLLLLPLPFYSPSPSISPILAPLHSRGLGLATPRAPTLDKQQPYQHEHHVGSASRGQRSATARHHLRSKVISAQCYSTIHYTVHYNTVH